MKKTINFNDFCDELNRYEAAKDKFTYDGKEALYNYLSDLEEDQGSEIELDVIDLCCEYNEYKNLKEFHEDYDKKQYPDFVTLSEHTTVIQIHENGDDFIIQQF